VSQYSKFNNKNNKKMVKKLILLAFAFCAWIPAKSQNTEVTISVTNVASDKGVITVCLFNNSDAFPQKPNLAYKCTTTNAQKGTIDIKIDGIKPSEYAIAVHHDKNKDGKVNTNFLGIPTEAVGASNGAKGTMGPPKYKDAALRIEKNTKVIGIALE
jgi:uncharacterized protein (DUF2141 family)